MLSHCQGNEEILSMVCRSYWQCDKLQYILTLLFKKSRFVFYPRDAWSVCFPLYIPNEHLFMGSHRLRERINTIYGIPFILIGNGVDTYSKDSIFSQDDDYDDDDDN